MLEWPDKQVIHEDPAKNAPPAELRLGSLAGLHQWPLAVVVAGQLAIKEGLSLAAFSFDRELLYDVCT